MSDEQPPKKSKILEAILELGRNWGLATALAAFSVAMLGTEAIHGIAVYKQAIGLTGIAIAMSWIILAIERAVQVAELPSQTRKQKLLQVFANLVLMGCGATIVYGVASMSENRRFVQICTEYSDRPDSGVFNDPKCQQLYRERADLADRLNRIPVKKPNH